MRKKADRLVQYYWTVVVYTVFVILWGAYVRATGSGAGCGSHWPLCNGVVLPTDPARATLIEFFHRVTSGLSLVLILFGGAWTFRRFRKGSFARKMAGFSVISILFEALIGAGLVLFELVLHDQSLKRVFSMMLHLVNTLVLVGTLVLTAASIKRNGAGWKWSDFPDRNPAARYLALFFLIGITGALAALGDTLFPAQSLSEGLKQDWLSSSHILVQIRGFHPIIALIFSFSFIRWVWFDVLLNQKLGSPTQAFGKGLIVFVAANFILGWVNLGLLAPVPMQLIHLGVGLMAWIYFVLFLDALGNSSSRG